MQSRRAMHRPPKRIGRKLFLLFFFLLLTAAGTYALRLYSQTKYALDGTYHAGTTKVATEIKDEKPFAALLLGVDTGAEGRIDKGNSDTIIVAVVNPKTKSTTMVSIPRDTVAQLIGADKFNMQKINAAYNVGGSEMAINTVSRLVNVPISYYLTINMGALEKVVDAVGGVDVNVPFDFVSNHTGGQAFKKGPAHLDGKRALVYSRMRYEDPRGDYGRQERQQQVIKGILKKAVSLDTLGNFGGLMKTVSKNIATNLSFADMTSIVANYRSAAETIKSDQLKGKNAMILNPDVYPTALSYQVPANDELQRISDKLRAALGLDSEPIQNQNIRENNANVNFDWHSEGNQDYTIFNPEL